MRSRSLVLLLVVALSTWTYAQIQSTSEPGAPPAQGGSSQGSATPSGGASQAPVTIYSPDGTKIGERPPGTPPPELKPLPTNTILIRGAWASATDSSTPLPEGGTITDNVYRNQYFGLNYSVPATWHQKFEGPPPSDSGYYVLAQLQPNDKFKGSMKGTVLFAAQDLFFGPIKANNSVELLMHVKNSLQPVYQVERQPDIVTIGNHPFVRFDYSAPVAELHWYILATQIRCHSVEFIFTSRDTKLLEGLVDSVSKMKLPAEADPASGAGGGDVPVCIKDYATGKNIVNRVDPVLTDRKFNPIPVRIIISKTGKVKHIHFLSAWPEQTNIIKNALLQWEFKPYLVNGEPVEVETGIMFGVAATPSKTAGKKAITN